MAKKSTTLSDDTRRNIGNRFREVRDNLGLTQDELAEVLERTTRQISRWETGENIVPTEILVTLYDLFQVDVMYVLIGKHFFDRELFLEDFKKYCEDVQRNRQY